MPLSSIISVQLRPKKAQRYRALASEFSQRAREEGESMQWTAHESVIGETNRIHFVSGAESFSELSARGMLPELFVRVLGEAKAEKFIESIAECVEVQTQEISTSRPELSYLPSEPVPGEKPFAVVTVLDVLPGQQDACEELLRKVAEAIPKANPEVVMATAQPVVGNLNRFWTIRPISDIGELDQQLPPAQLLTEAFGAAEGGLIYRSGLAAIQSAQRNILLYRPELSNVS